MVGFGGLGLLQCCGLRSRALGLKCGALLRGYELRVPGGWGHTVIIFILIIVTIVIIIVIIIVITVIVIIIITMIIIITRAFLMSTAKQGCRIWAWSSMGHSRGYIIQGFCRDDLPAFY